jgi:hypothetical protein
MTDKQPEALRLADGLEQGFQTGSISAQLDQAAAELRRLHEVNAELVEVLRKISMGGDPRWADDALAKVTGEQQ